MIKLKIITKEGKIVTDYDEDDVCLNDVSLIVYEFERIKLDLLNKGFVVDKISYNKEDDENTTKE